MQIKYDLIRKLTDNSHPTFQTIVTDVVMKQGIAALKNHIVMHPDMWEDKKEYERMMKAIGEAEEKEANRELKFDGKYVNRKNF